MCEITERVKIFLKKNSQKKRLYTELILAW